MNRGSGLYAILVSDTSHASMNLVRLSITAKSHLPAPNT